MASSARNSSNKHQKPSTDIDRISSLPESVLSHILSLLPTEYAVATSLVSKRFKSLWTKIHNLSFGGFGSPSEFYGHVMFSYFVNRVLLLTSPQRIKSFYLEMGAYSELYDVSSWVATAVSRNVKVLEIVLRYFNFDDPLMQLPYSLCACDTLEVLVLSCSVSLNVPSLVYLPNLKKLHLESVIYECDESVCNLLSGCSSLETLCIERDLFDNVVTFSISSPTLISLAYKHDEQPHIPFPTLDYKLEINAPALRYLNLCDFLSKDFSVNNFCLLDEATIWIRDIKDEVHGDSPIDEHVIDVDLYSVAVVELLQSLSNVKHLTLEGDVLKALGHAGGCLNFSRLTRLNVERARFPWNSLLCLIQGSNKLSHLSLSTRFRDDKKPSWIEPGKVPRCLITCLETITISGSKWQEEELEMAAYILKNARRLKMMTIKTYDLDVVTKFQLLQKVSMFSRVSEKCQISFS